MRSHDHAARQRVAVEVVVEDQVVVVMGLVADQRAVGIARHRIASDQPVRGADQVNGPAAVSCFVGFKGRLPGHPVGAPVNNRPGEASLFFATL